MFYFIPVQLPCLLTSVLNTGNAEVGFIGLGTLASAISALIFKRLKDFAGFPMLMAMAFALMAFGFYLISRSETYITMLTSIFISGLGLGIFIPTSNLWTMQTAPLELRGTALGIMNTFMILGQFFSPIVAFPVIDAFNLQIAFFVAGGFLLLLSLLVFLLAKTN